MSKKTIVKGRVSNAGEGGKTPIAGAPQHKAPSMKRTRMPKRTSEMPRKNDPPHTAMERMGLHIGGRVTRGKGKS